MTVLLKCSKKDQNDIPFFLSFSDLQIAWELNKSVNYIHVNMVTQCVCLPSPLSALSCLVWRSLVWFCPKNGSVAVVISLDVSMLCPSVRIWFGSWWFCTAGLRNASSWKWNPTSWWFRKGSVTIVISPLVQIWLVSWQFCTTASHNVSFRNYSLCILV